MPPAYKVDERVLKNILAVNITEISPDTKLNLIIYYKNTKTSNLIMKNNLQVQGKLKSSNVIYRFKCPDEDCQLRPKEYYVGYTQTTLSRRLTMHLGKGAIKDHSEQEHQATMTRDAIVKNTEIIRRESNAIRLQIAEAIIIMIDDPHINRQDTGKARTLKLFS